jgi:hypothetical protein
MWDTWKNSLKNDQKLEKQNPFWWEVVIAEPCQGASPHVMNVVKNKPYTREYEEIITPIYQPDNGSIVWVMFELAQDEEAASYAAKCRLEWHTRTPEWSSAWGKTRNRWYKQVQEAAEQDRLRKPATVGDIEKLIEAIKGQV